MKWVSCLRSTRLDAAKRVVLWLIFGLPLIAAVAMRSTYIDHGRGHGAPAGVHGMPDAGTARELIVRATARPDWSGGGRADLIRCAGLLLSSHDASDRKSGAEEVFRFVDRFGVSAESLALVSQGGRDADRGTRAIILCALVLGMAQDLRCSVQWLIAPSTFPDVPWVLGADSATVASVPVDQAEQIIHARWTSGSMFLHERQLLRALVVEEKDLEIRLLGASVLARVGSRDDLLFLVQFLEEEPGSLRPVPTDEQRLRASSVLADVTGRHGGSAADWKFWMERNRTR